MEASEPPPSLGLCKPSKKVDLRTLGLRRIPFGAEQATGRPRLRARESGFHEGAGPPGLRFTFLAHGQCGHSVYTVFMQSVGSHSLKHRSAGSGRRALLAALAKILFT